ncbi:olfactory receptor 5T3-like [Canis lupus dingo]|uniref:olfactory receptor 5T3-like n=1 Tax=Canis lupus dingo TaxID=286419 RepID=UPI000DC69CAA|nr:olfactory receptor 5T3-like [Canis lupus dingo]
MNIVKGLWRSVGQWSCTSGPSHSESCVFLEYPVVISPVPERLIGIEQLSPLENPHIDSLTCRRDILRLVILVIGDSRLHNPMYYFLSVLSFLDACYSSVVTPKMLVNFLAEDKSISYLRCAAQMLLFVTFGTTECFLLAAMAYDRYVAIYNPLLYSVSMSPRVYVPLIVASNVGRILHASVHTVATFSLSFCASNEIRHVFCDIPPLLAISCSDIHINQLLLFSKLYFVFPEP